MPEPQCFGHDLVNALHEQSLRLHGGLAEVRNVHVLEAALASPRNLDRLCLLEGRGVRIARITDRHAHHLGGNPNTTPRLRKSSSLVTSNMECCLTQAQNAVSLPLPRRKATTKRDRASWLPDEQEGREA